jgi:hypothetical protein
MSTRYWQDNSEFEPRWRRAHPASITMDTGRHVALTTHSIPILCLQLHLYLYADSTNKHCALFREQKAQKV